jgi:YVTN family beta-propeller protein
LVHGRGQTVEALSLQARQAAAIVGMSKIHSSYIFALLLTSNLAAGPALQAGGSAWAPLAGALSPSALVATKDGEILFVACVSAKRILQFDTAQGRVVDCVPVPEPPTGLALSPDESWLYVTCAAAESPICILFRGTGSPRTLESRQSVQPTAPSSSATTILAGHTAMSPVLSQDGKTLFVCNRFNNTVSVIDLATRKVVDEIAVQREPVAADISKDGKYLFVANHLPNRAANADYVAAVVSVLDPARGELVKELHLPNGSTALKDIRVSPSGKYAAVTHTVAHFQKPTVRPFPDWINANALTVIDVNKLEVIGSVLLDDRTKGAANPWGLAWSADSRTLVVAHSGTHEISVIDFPALLEKLLDLPAPIDPLRPGISLTFSPQDLAQANYLPYFPSSRRRVKLPPTDLGPRAVVIAGHTAYVANYFSDTLTALDLSDPNAQPESIPLTTNRWAVPQASKPAFPGARPGIPPHYEVRLEIPLTPAPLPEERGSRRAASRLGSMAPSPACSLKQGHAGEGAGAPSHPAPVKEMPLARKGEFYFHDATICFQG